jgi:hypothetical protein
MYCVTITVFLTSMGPKRIISKFELFSHHLTVVVRPFCICYLKDIFLWNHWFNFNQSCPDSSLFIIKVSTFKIQQISVFPTHYCEQQFSVSTLDFNIHLFSTFPCRLAVIVSCSTWHSHTLQYNLLILSVLIILYNIII